MQFRRSGTGLHPKGFIFTVMLGLISLVYVVALPVSGLDIRSTDFSELVRRDEVWLTQINILTPRPESERAQKIRKSTQELQDITTTIQTKIRESIKINTGFKVYHDWDATRMARLGRFVKGAAYFPEDKGKNVETLNLDDPKYLKSDIGIQILWESLDYILTSYGGIHLSDSTTLPGSTTVPREPSTISVYFAFPPPTTFDVVRYGCARVVSFELVSAVYVLSIYPSLLTVFKLRQIA
ncbi:hypothetical protein F5050DRAFT_1757506 [Lentinula boryana]|uniref:Uncharacterized protein n=1 Tax=Lentinula boryana TaxID=40481 RepID=A0ABQ8QDP7_9AGAR|nr:hypothetical protein F5050DRAFT_1757506 [Lentinula boryana]